MLKLNLPDYEPILRKSDDKLYIKCLIRKKFIRLSPEEWVRQHFLNFLISVGGFSSNRCKLEMPLVYNGLRKRIDIMLFNNELIPEIMVECKSFDVKLDLKTVHQIAAYNMDFQVGLLCITNGMNHFWFHKTNDGYVLLDHAPF